MKLIYLDTSDFILLSNKKKTGDKLYTDFLLTWKNTDCVLALTQIHLVELLQAKHFETRSAHFELLKDFLPFRYESENFFEREIVGELVRKGFIIFPENDKDFAIRIFSKAIETEEDIAVIYSASNIISRIGFYKAFSKANQKSWEAKSTNTLHTTPKPRFSNMGNQWLGLLGKKLFAKFIGVDFKDKKNQNKTIEALLEDFLFKIQVKSSLKAHFGKAEKQLVLKILASIRVENCKGLWLRKEVEKNLKRSNDYDPNNESDLNHLQYLPYVDKFITDKRIVDKTIQVLRRNDLINSLTSVSYPIKSSNSIELLQQAIFE